MTIVTAVAIDAAAVTAAGISPSHGSGAEEYPVPPLMIQGPHGEPLGVVLRLQVVNRLCTDGDID